jgi:hypothetical protein
MLGVTLNGVSGLEIEALVNAVRSSSNGVLQGTAQGAR